MLNKLFSVLNYFLMGVCISLAVLVSLIESPQWMVGCLILQALMVAIFSGGLKSLWYSYVLFIVFLGGMLVLFTYVTSLASNLKMEYFFTKWASSFAIFLLLGVGMGSLELFILSSSEDSFMNSLYGVSGLLSSLSSGSYLYTVLYLLLSLFSIAWVLKSQEGPLRLLSV